MTESTVPVSQTPAPALWEDFIDIFYAPADVFRRRQAGNWFLPLLIITIALFVLSWASRGVLQPIMDAEFARQIVKMKAQNPNITEEQLQRGRHIGELAQQWGMLIIMPVMIILVGFMTWLVSRLVDSRQTLHAALVVAVYAYVPKVLEAILVAVQGLVVDTASLTSRYSLQLGPARFMNADTTPPLLLAVLGRLDLMTLWVTALLAIGVYATGKVSKQRAAIAGVLFWFVGGIPAFLGALRG